MRGAAVRRGTEELRAFLDHHATRGGTGLTERVPGVPDGPGPAGDVLAGPFRGGVDLRDLDLVPVGVHFVRDDAGEGGADMLAHFGADDVDVDRPVRSDGAPDIGLERGFRRHGRRKCRGSTGLAGETEHQPGAGRRHQEVAAGEARGVALFAICSILAIVGAFLLP